MFNKKINNNDLEIFYVEDPRDATDFPHNSANMRYDKDDHRYYLEESGLSHYDIDFDPKKAKWLIRKATEHIYSYIQIMAQTNYNLMCYRIAKSLLGSHRSAFEGRRDFERILAMQAEFINEFGDAKNTPKMVVNPETGRIKDQDLDMSSGFWLHDEVLSWLNANYLTDPNAIASAWRIDWSKY